MARAEPVDARVAALAARQHGVAARRQLLALGLSEKMVDGRIARGALHRVHQGIYAVGHKRLTREGHYMAAVLACGDGAALSHRSAGAHWGITNYSGRIAVTATTRRRRANSSFSVSSPKLHPDEITCHDGIPTTTVARTIVDLAATHPAAVDRAIREAEYRRLFDLTDLEHLLARYPTRKGSGRLRALLACFGEANAHTRSDLEERFLVLAGEAGLPLPDVNALVELPSGVIEADIVWRDRHLVVELDGWQAHGTRSAFERDRERDLALAAAGWRTVRVTWLGLSDGIPPDLLRLIAQ